MVAAHKTKLRSDYRALEYAVDKVRRTGEENGETGARERRAVFSEAQKENTRRSAVHTHTEYLCPVYSLVWT
jgi:hypothetical protein